MDTSDTELTDEILASGPGNWTAAPAGMEVFACTSTPAGASKNASAPGIEALDNSFGWSRSCTVDDVEILNKEVFALAAMYGAFTKNPPGVVFQGYRGLGRSGHAIS